jgi:predicted deacylase
VLRVLEHLGMIEDRHRLTEIGVPARSNKTQWVRATRGGVAHRTKTSGDPVRTGDLLATVTGLLGEDPLPLVSPIDGIVIGHATLPVVHQGEALFHIARVDHPELVDARIDSISAVIAASEPEGFAEALLDEDEVI